MGKLFSLLGKVVIVAAELFNIRKHSEATSLVESLRFYGYKYQIDAQLSAGGLQYMLHTECVGMNLHIPLGDTSLDSVIRYLKLQLKKQREKEAQQWEQSTV